MTETTHDVAVIGDGAAGLTAGLFLAKNGMDVVVLGDDGTHVHAAHLHNYPGLGPTLGDDWVATVRDQCEGFGADLRDALVTSARSDGDVFVLEAEDGAEVASRYVVVAAGWNPEVVEDLGVDLEDGVVPVDRDGRTSVDRVYAAGWSTRDEKIQVAISVGEGAAAALDILSREAGEPVHDFDSAD